ncbi:MAG: hypothetical protein KIT47_20855 [Rhodoferax sp.]|nr:hypothetical protein [Rhodoferax sp.]
MKLAMGGLVITGVASLAAYFLGGFGAVALGLVAVISGIFGAAFLVGALIQAASAGTSRTRASASEKQPPHHGEQQRR